MDEDALMGELRAEGYEKVCAVALEPHQATPPHTHERATIHVILAGEVKISEELTLKEGMRFEIPAGTTHIAVAGKDGCKFISGLR